MLKNKSAAAFDSILSCFLRKAKPDMKCESTRWEEIDGENADGKMVIKSLKSQELRRGEHPANKVSAPKHEFPVPRNETSSILQKLVSGLFRCQKIRYL